MVNEKKGTLLTIVVLRAICLLAVISCWIPVLFQTYFENTTSRLDDSELSDSLQNNVVLCALTGSIAVCVPLVFDMFLDSLFGHRKGDQVVFERLIFVSGVLLQSIIVLARANVSHVASLFFTTNGCSNIMVVYAVYAVTFKCRPDFGGKPIIFSFFTFAIGFSLPVIFPFSGTILMLSYILYWISLLIYAGRSGQILCRIYTENIANIADTNVADISFVVTSLVNAIFGASLQVYIAAMGAEVGQDRTPKQLLGLLIFWMAYTIVYNQCHTRSVRLCAYRTEKQLQTKRLVTRHIVHEMRTPLNIVNVGLGILISEFAAKGNRQDVLESSAQACCTALSLLDDTLLYDKLEAGFFALELSNVPIKPFLVATAKPFMLHAHAKGIIFDVLPHFDGSFNLSESIDNSDHYCVNIDAYKMSHVVRNFLSNAVKFTPAGGTITIDATRRPEIGKYLTKSGAVKVSTKPDTVVISVTDSGVGLAPNHQQKLFHEVIQINANKHQDGRGSGFGLKIAKGVADMHLGKIGVTSEGEGEGSTFFLELPLVMDTSPSFDYIAATMKWNMQEKQQPAALNVDNLSTSLIDVEGTETPKCIPSEKEYLVKSTSSSARPLSSGSNAYVGRKTGRKILIVDDSLLTRKMMVQCISRMDVFSCYLANNGEEAVTKVKESMQAGEEGYIAIIMDCIMPKLSGPAAVTAIRKMQYAGMIIGLTGLSGVEVCDNFLDSGANAVLMKPVDTEKLRTLLVGALVS